MPSRPSYIANCLRKFQNGQREDRRLYDQCSMLAVRGVLGMRNGFESLGTLTIICLRLPSEHSRIAT